MDRQLGNLLPMPPPINAPTIWGIPDLVCEEIKSAAMRFLPKAEVEAAQTQVKKLEDDDLASNTNLKSLEVKAMGTLNAALCKINKQEERIKQLETTRKLDLQNLGVGGVGDLNLGASHTPTTPGCLTGLENRIAKLETTTMSLLFVFQSWASEICRKLMHGSVRNPDSLIRIGGRRVYIVGASGGR